MVPSLKHVPVKYGKWVGTWTKFIKVTKEISTVSKGQVKYGELKEGKKLPDDEGCKDLSSVWASSRV